LHKSIEQHTSKKKTKGEDRKIQRRSIEKEEDKKKRCEVGKIICDIHYLRKRISKEESNESILSLELK